MRLQPFATGLALYLLTETIRIFFDPENPLATIESLPDGRGTRDCTLFPTRASYSFCIAASQVGLESACLVVSGLTHARSMVGFSFEQYDS